MYTPLGAEAPQLSAHAPGGVAAADRGVARASPLV